MSGCGNCDAISKIWSVIIFIFIHGYVLYRGVTRYVVVKDQILSQRYGVDWDKTVMNYLLWSLVISLFFTVLCIYAFVQKTGHLANDGIQLKRETQRIIALLNDGDNTTICPNTISKAVSPPTCWNIRLFSGVLYLLSAYLLLLPIPWIVSQQIKHQATAPEYLWQTDLSFLFPPHPLASRLTKYTELHSELVSDHRLAAASLFSLQPPALGGLGQLPQTDRQVETANRLRWIDTDSLVRLIPDVGHPIPSTTAPKSISIELINFILAGLLIGISVPSVFWHLSALYACVTSFLIGITILHLTVDFASTSLLIQYATCLTYPDQSDYNMGLSSSQTYEKLRASLMLIQSPVQLPAWVLVLLSGLAFLPYLINLHLVYAFGLACLGQWDHPHGHVDQAHRRYGCQGNAHTSTAVSLQSGYSLHQPADTAVNETSGTGIIRRSLIKPVCGSIRTSGSKTAWHWMRVHNSTMVALFGMGFLILSTGLRIPIECELMRVYWENGDPLCLTSMVLFVINFLAWLLVWISFLLRKPYLFPVWESNTTAMKNSTDNLLASFNNENAAYVRCNGDLSMVERLPGVSSDNGAVPIFLDGDTLLYSTVQKNTNTHHLNLPRSEQSTSPLTLTAFNRQWRPTTGTAVALTQEANEAVCLSRHPDDPVQSTTSDCAQLGRMSDTNGTLKRSINSNKPDTMRSFSPPPPNGLPRIDTREQMASYAGEPLLVSTVGEINSKLFGTLTSVQNGSVAVRAGNTCTLDTTSYPTGTAQHYAIPVVNTVKTVHNIDPIPSDCPDGDHQTISGDQGPQRVPFRHVTQKSPYILMTTGQTETRTDSSDSGDSACKLSENQDCLASVRSYRYNLASLESQLMVGAVSNGEGDRSSSPVSLPPPMSTLSSYLYDSSTREGYTDFVDQPNHSWNGTNGLVILSASNGLCADSQNQTNQLFDGKLSSQV